MLQNVNKVLFSYRLASKDKATKENIEKNGGYFNVLILVNME